MISASSDFDHRAPMMNLIGRPHLLSLTHAAVSGYEQEATFWGENIFPALKKAAVKASGTSAYERRAARGPFATLMGRSNSFEETRESDRSSGGAGRGRGGGSSDALGEEEREEGTEVFSAYMDMVAADWLESGQATPRQHHRTRAFLHVCRCKCSHKAAATLPRDRSSR